MKTALQEADEAEEDEKRPKDAKGRVILTEEEKRVKDEKEKKKYAEVSSLQTELPVMLTVCLENGRAC